MHSSWHRASSSSVVTPGVTAAPTICRTSAGTGRAGLTRPGRTWSVLALWQRLNLRPLPHQQGSLALRARAVIEAVAMTRPGYRASDNVITRRRKRSRGRVCRLSKFTTQSVGTPSARDVRSSSDTRPRRVRVNAATTTAPIRSATGSRVSTRTGRSPPGVAANQTSPRRIGPVRPILGWAPVGDVGERLLAVVQRLASPGLGIVLALEAQEVTPERLTEQLRPVNSQPLGPGLCLGRLVLVDAEAQHCHTASLARMTQVGDADWAVPVNGSPTGWATSTPSPSSNPRWRAPPPDRPPDRRGHPGTPSPRGMMEPGGTGRRRGGGDAGRARGHRAARRADAPRRAVRDGPRHRSPPPGGDRAGRGRRRTGGLGRMRGRG